MIAGTGCSLSLGSGCGCGEQATHVLDYYEPGLQRLDGRDHVRPETRAGTGREARALADGRDVLTGEPSDQHVDCRNGGPVHGRNVTEIGSFRPVMSEDASDRSVYLGEPDRLAAGSVFDGEVEAAISAEQRPDPWRAIIAGRCVVHERSGGSVSPIPNPVLGPSSGRSPARCSLALTHQKASYQHPHRLFT